MGEPEGHQAGKALVFGGAGFIGQATCRTLERRGVEPVIADIAEADGFECHHVDVANAEDVMVITKKVAPDVVVHLAYLLGPETESAHPRRALEINVMGTQAVFEACREAAVSRCVYCSSVAVYGDQSEWGDHALTEEDLGRPVIHYGWHKQLNEATAALYQRDYGLRCIGLRISSVYGPGRKTGMSAVIGNLIDAAATGGPVRSRMRADTDSDAIHVEDVGEAMALLTVTRAPQHDIYNSGGEFCTLGEIADKLRERIPGITIELANDGPRLLHVSRVDWSRLRDEFSVPPRLTLDERIDEMLALSKAP